MGYMKKGLVTIIVLCISTSVVFAQNKAGVTINKDGLVTASGKKVFYLVSKSDVPWESDYALEDMQHRQLAYFKFAKGYHYTSNSNTHLEVQYYKLTFTKDGAHCEVRDYMKYGNTISKALATVIVNAKLVKNGSIDAAAEKKFVLANNGFMTPAKEDTSTGISNSAVPHNDTDSLNGTILLKDGFIYYEQQIIGTYKKTDIDTDLVSVQVFSVSRNKVAEVTHVSGEAEWRVVTVVDQERVQVPYDKSNPLKELFRYLLKKRYL